MNETRPNQLSRCPKCQKLQANDEFKCVYCGNPFHRLNGMDSSATPILNTSSGYSAFKSDPKIKVIFAILIFCAEPFVQSMQNMTHGALPLPTWAAMSLICTVLGFACGCLARAAGRSPVFTAGGAGILGGLARMVVTTLLASVPLKSAIQSSMLVYGIYSVGAIAGGLLAWICIRLSSNKQSQEMSSKKGSAYILYKGKKVTPEQAVEMMRASRTPSSPAAAPARVEPSQANASVLQHVPRENQEPAGNDAVLMKQSCAFKFFVNQTHWISAQGHLIYQTGKNDGVEIGVRLSKIDESDIEAVLVMLIESKCRVREGGDLK